MSQDSDVAESIRVLSAVSFSNFSFYCERVLPGRRSEPVAKSVPKQLRSLLDALTFFLATIPNDGRVYAMTLAATGEEIIATIAANNATHFDPAPQHSNNAFPESQDPPRIILTRIWEFMTAIAATTDTDTDVKLKFKMTQYLLRSHALKIRSRFEKRSKEFKQFWDVLTTDKNSGLDQGVTYATASDTVKSYLDEAKAIFDCQQEFCSNGDVNTLIKEMDRPFKCRTLEKSLSIFDKAYIYEIQKAVGSNNKQQFNLIRYISKLCSPVLNAVAIRDGTTDPRVKDLSKLPLQIHQADIPPPTIFEAADVPSNVLEKFLRDAYEPSRQYDIEALNEVIKKYIGNARKGKTIISAPHCECLLIRHHELAAPSVPPPFSYISVSKLSCFQCGIYLDAYNASSKRKVPAEFWIKGRHNDVIPCVLPTISEEVDSSIAEHMMKLIRTVVTVMLDEDIKALELSSFLQSIEKDNEEMKEMAALEEGLV